MWRKKTRDKKAGKTPNTRYSQKVKQFKYVYPNQLVTSSANLYVSINVEVVLASRSYEWKRMQYRPLTIVESLQLERYLPTKDSIGWILMESTPSVLTADSLGVRTIFTFGGIETSVGYHQWKHFHF